MTRWAEKVSPANVHPEYPRPQLVRDEWQNLNGLWQYAIAGEKEDPPLGKNLDNRILVPFPVESSLSGVMKRAERLWYRRTFNVESWVEKDKRVLLHFGALDWEATVWINGKRMGSHRGGYDPFEFDITDALNPLGEQEIIVGVYDPSDGGYQPRGKQVKKPRGIWYTPTTGIWQTVWLEPVPGTAHISGLKITPDLDAQSVTVTVHGRGFGPKHALHAEAKAMSKVSEASTTGGNKLVLVVPDPRPWSPEDPFLYDLTVQLFEGDALIDTVRSYFGMRKISIGKDEMDITRIFLNNNPLFMCGPLDQGFWPDGLYTAPSDEALRYDIEVTRQLGFNMARKHVKIEPDRWYYWADRLGLMVWQDMPSANNQESKEKAVGSGEPGTHFEKELKAMVDAFHNHPSIVMWVVFNEGWGQYDTERLTQWVKEYDPSRLVNSASGWSDMGVGDVKDIHAYPGPACPPSEPNRAAVLGEFGGLGLALEDHTWQEKENWGYRNMQNPGELTDRYVQLVDTVRRLIAYPGLCAAVYTQTTDVEIEVNGLMTYDRAVIKPDSVRIAKSNQALYAPPPRIAVAIPTSQEQGFPWKYTLEEPEGNWFQLGYNDQSWERGQGGFGTKETPGAMVRTEWNTSDIWLRRKVVLPAEQLQNPQLLLHHDEDATVYINGILAAHVEGYTTSYVFVEMTADGRAALRAGENLIAIHCRQNSGGQYIDAGLLDVIEPPEEK
jgi:hypothetical protein